MNTNGGTSFFGSDWLGAFLIIAILFGGGMWGGNRGPAPATQEYVQTAIDNASIQNQLHGIALSSANNNYEVAQRINDQTMALMQQGYAYQLSAEGRYNQIQQQIAQLGFQMDQCCCKIQTQLLQSQYDETLRELAKAQNDASNAAQSAYLLSVMGKWVANPASAA